MSKTTEDEAYIAMWGEGFWKVRQAAIAQMHQDFVNSSPTAQFLTLLHMRLDFFGGWSHMPQAMMAPIEAAIGRLLFDKPFSIDTAGYEPVSAEYFQTAVSFLVSGQIQLTEEQLRAFVDVLNIGATKR